MSLSFHSIIGLHTVFAFSSHRSMNFRFFPLSFISIISPWFSIPGRESCSYSGFCSWPVMSVSFSPILSFFVLPNTSNSDRWLLAWLSSQRTPVAIIRFRQDVSFRIAQQYLARRVGGIFFFTIRLHMVNRRFFGSDLLISGFSISHLIPRFSNSLNFSRI